MIREHFTTRGTPAGHGFTQTNLEAGEGNYSFTPKPGLRFVVLDSVAAAGPTAISTTRSSSGSTHSSWQPKAACELVLVRAPRSALDDPTGKQCALRAHRNARQRRRSTRRPQTSRCAASSNVTAP